MKNSKKKKEKKRNSIYFFIILLVALIDICYGTFFQINKYTYQKNTEEVVANIHQITKNKDTNTLYIDYYVNNKLYNGVLATKNKNITVDDDLTIYYNKNKPREFNDGIISYAGYYIIFLGIVIVLIDSKFFLSIKEK